jgi:Domain of unknown function (DUF4337)
MSEESFEVDGPEKHAVEHQAHSGDSLAGRIAVMTAILATVGAVFSYQGGSTQNDAMMYKNDALLKRTEASDQWAFYQAKSTKQHLAELAAAIVPGDRKAAYQAEVERYKQEKKEIQARAEALEAESKKFNELSEHSLHPHHRLAQATTLIQIAISLAAITVLTRKLWLFWGSGLAAGLGIVLWVLAWLGG